MKILTPAIASNKSNHLLQIQKKAEFLPPLSVGEVVEAEIAESTRYGKALILMKNRPVMAYSELSLTKGEKITVRVAQLHPGVVLHVAQNESSQKSRTMDYSRFNPSDPRVLSEFFMKGIDRFDPEKLGKLAAHLGKEDIKNIQNILKSLIFSRESVKDPLFFRDYIHKFGYLMEKERGDTLKRRSGGTATASRNLKELLLRVSGKLQSLIEIENLPPAEKLAGFVRSSLQTIESHQAVNYLFQEYEGKYMFQIPLLFPESMGMAEIFVKFGEHEGKGRREGKNILFLLSMDVLGDIVVEATIKTKKIGCLLQCGNENVCDFIRPFLRELEDALMTLGYEIEYLSCITQKSSFRQENEHREFQSLSALEGVDILA